MMSCSSKIRDRMVETPGRCGKPLYNGTSTDHQQTSHFADMIILWLSTVDHLHWHWSVQDQWLIDILKCDLDWSPENLSLFRSVDQQTQPAVDHLRWHLSVRDQRPADREIHCTFLMGPGPPDISLSRYDQYQIISICDCKCIVHPLQKLLFIPFINYVSLGQMSWNILVFKKQADPNRFRQGQCGKLQLIHPIYLYLAHVSFDGPTIFLTYSLSCIAINPDNCNLKKRYCLEQLE